MMDAVSATIFYGVQAIRQKQSVVVELNYLSGCYRLVWATAKSIAASYILFFENL
jgi:hypothetical protein